MGWQISGYAAQEAAGDLVKDSMNVINCRKPVVMTFLKPKAQGRPQLREERAETIQRRWLRKNGVLAEVRSFTYDPFEDTEDEEAVKEEERRRWALERMTGEEAERWKRERELADLEAARAAAVAARARMPAPDSVAPPPPIVG